jgi:hypothetical protein
MRKIKYLAVAGALATLALPAVAFADQPTALVWKDNTSYDQTNNVGKWSSQLTHNGVLIRDEDNRRGIIQEIHADQGRGSLAK